MTKIFTENRLAFICMALTLLIYTGCSEPSQPALNDLQPKNESVNANVIYGADGRLDLFQVSDERLVRLANSTVALIKNESLRPSNSPNSLVQILGSNYGTSRNLCSTEKFREQNTGAFCSGFLVRSDIIITAGHCIEAMPDCNNTSFVFGYALKQAGVLPASVPSSDIYRCKEIIKTQSPSNGADFAVIRLDRKVVGHLPLELRNTSQSGPITVGEELVVIGHPVGLPTKVTTGGKVRSTANSEYFVASVDTYGGNSGSAVFNTRTGLVEGILVRGEADFTSQGSCTVSKVCTEEACRGEDITRISVAAQFVPAESGGDNPPPPPPPNPPESFSVTVNQAIPDNNQKGIMSSLLVNSATGSRKVNIKIDVKHSYIGDLVVQVIAPDGKSTTLHSRAGGGTDDIVKSYEVTTVFANTSAGNYRLIVKDVAKRDTGKLISWGIDLL